MLLGKKYIELASWSADGSMSMCHFWFCCWISSCAKCFVSCVICACSTQGHYTAHSPHCSLGVLLSCVGPFHSTVFLRCDLERVSKFPEVVTLLVPWATGHNLWLQPVEICSSQTPVSECINTQTDADFPASGRGLRHHLKISNPLYHLIFVWPRETSKGDKSSGYRWQQCCL